MRTAKKKTKTRKKTKAAREKAAPKSVVKRRRPRNLQRDQPLSFDLPSKDDVTVQAGAAPNQLVHDSINLVLAECDKVAAALIEITQDYDLPPLTIRPVDTRDDSSVANTGWAVVSDDPQRPLTETEARTIVAAMRWPRTSAPLRIAAE